MTTTSNCSKCNSMLVDRCDILRIVTYACGAKRGVDIATPFFVSSDDCVLLQAERIKKRREREGHAEREQYERLRTKYRDDYCHYCEGRITGSVAHVLVERNGEFEFEAYYCCDECMYADGVAKRETH